MSEEKIRTRFDKLANGFRIVKEAEEDGNWILASECKFWNDAPGIIQVGTVEDNVPLTHDQAKMLATTLQELVQYSERYVATLLGAKSICPRCQHQKELEGENEEYVVSSHPCANCGAPEWREFVARDDA